MRLEEHSNSDRFVLFLLGDFTSLQFNGECHYNDCFGDEIKYKCEMGKIIKYMHTHKCIIWWK